MNFKPEFIKTLSSNIWEAEKKDFYPNQSKNKIIPKTPAKSQSNDALREKSFYEILISPHGFQEFSDFVLKKVETKSMLSPKSGSEKAIAMSLNAVLSTEQKNLLEKELESMELDEFKLMNLFKEIYMEVFEFKIYELFEIYEMKPNTRLGFKEIYLIITFTAACECGQVLEYLYLFGNMLFNYLSCGNAVAFGVRLRQFAKLIGFSERVISKYMKELDISDNKKHNLEDFELLMFALFEEKDSTAPESPEKNNKIQVGNSTKKEGKYKTCKGLCIIF
jgi:hypothetical protein